MSLYLFFVVVDLNNNISVLFQRLYKLDCLRFSVRLIITRKRKQNKNNQEQEEEKNSYHKKLTKNSKVLISVTYFNKGST